MADITQFETFADGTALLAETFNKNIFQAGRTAPLTGTKGGFEVTHGQLTKPNFSASSLGLTARHVRRGTFAQGPFVSGVSVNRDLVGTSLFVDIDPSSYPDNVNAAVPVVGVTWENRSPVSALDISFHVVYVQRTNQSADSGAGVTNHNYGKSGFAGLFLDGIYISQLSQNISNGRSSTVNSDSNAAPYNNNSLYPDLRVWSGSYMVDLTQVGVYTLGGILGAGWHTATIRVITERSMLRIKTAHMKVIPRR